IDSAMAPLAESLLSAQASVEDLALDVRDRLHRLEASPGRLEEVENRLAQLDRLKRKYGPTLRDVLQHLDTVSRQVEQSESGEQAIQTLQGQVREAAQAYKKTSSELSAKRAKTAKDLKRAVEKELSALAM